ncbi:hypothetical protein SynA1562_01590 [Synechococcus sp. A15-62]|nr:hypothetical protein SynA1562_01590 [Synechococcus sp. A15-62]
MILPSWRQAIGKGGFLALCLPPCHVFTLQAAANKKTPE